jgi:hypothetical protein
MENLSEEASVAISQIIEAGLLCDPSSSHMEQQSILCSDRDPRCRLFQLDAKTMVGSTQLGFTGQKSQWLLQHVTKQLL